MSYKESCKEESVVITRIKILRMYFNNVSCKEIALKWKCNKNTISNIIKKCSFASNEALEYLMNNINIPSDKLYLFDFLDNKSRKPLSHSRCLSDTDSQIILDKHTATKYGAKRMYNHLKRQGYDMCVYTLAKIKGVYKRNKLKIKKKRSANGNRRDLYNYDEIEAFEFLQYDVKQVLDLKALPLDIYKKFKNNPRLPIYQWTIIDVKTRVRFLAWSHNTDSYFGFKFLEFVIVWLRSHNVYCEMNFQFDGGGEFCSASERKLGDWNEKLKKYDVTVSQTDGVKWKQNIVERSHRTDDEEFYCPRGEYINSKDDFLKEAQFWIMYFNNRSHMGLDGLTPKEKLKISGYPNASTICNFPVLILEDYYKPLTDFFNSVFLKKSSYYVLTYYLIF
jgi:hypothetical protein